MAVGDKTLNSPSSLHITTADRFWELKMLTFRSSYIFHLRIKISFGF